MNGIVGLIREERTNRKTASFANKEMEGLSSISNLKELVLHSSR